MLDDDATSATREARSPSELIPVYPGVPPSSRTWKIAKSGRAGPGRSCGDRARPAARRRTARSAGCSPLVEALRLVHRPGDRRTSGRAQQRLRWDEAFAAPGGPGPAPGRRPPRCRRPRAPGRARAARPFDAALPFALTDGQREVGRARSPPTSPATTRCTGCSRARWARGKTVVALRAMLAVVDAGGQAALLAPTEVLAQQHHRSITRAARAAGRARPARRGRAGHPRRAAHRLAAHRRTPPGAARRRLRRGGHRDRHPRAASRTRSTSTTSGWWSSTSSTASASSSATPCGPRPTTPPHVLVMTATPIPRTVAMTVFGDLEVSTLTELPAGRSPIATHVVPAGDKPHFLERAWERIREEVAAGHQAYVVCPRIGEVDGADADGADPADAAGPARRARAGDRAPRAAAARRPRRGAQLRRGAAGRPAGRGAARPDAPEAKDDVMRRFAAGEVDVLVATTVIEVGVDVPNATVMVVMDADRFGVSQLHQLRGRVGRGPRAGPVPARHRRRGRSPARDAAGGGGRHARRLRAVPRRPGDTAARATCSAPSSPAAGRACGCSR